MCFSKKEIKMQNSNTTAVKTSPVQPVIRIMTVAEWDAEFNPIKNHLDDNASLDGFMFETYKEEIEFVRQYDQTKVWTYIADGGIDEKLAKDAGYSLQADPNGTIDDDMDWYNSSGESLFDGMFSAGYHYVNRLGYLLTEKAAEEGVEYIIYMDDDVAEAAKKAYLAGYFK
jgi:hypothetical protein